MRYTAFVVPVTKRHFAPGQLQFITSGGYHRTEPFDSSRSRPRRDFVEVPPATSGGSRDLLAAK
jgi:hypothetical protein